MAQKQKSVIVTLSDDGVKNIQQLAHDLGAKGMKVNRVMPITGVISGSIASSKMSTLNAIEGVQSVEEELRAELPPPGSSPQ